MSQVLLKFPSLPRRGMIAGGDFPTNIILNPQRTGLGNEPFCASRKNLKKVMSASRHRANQPNKQTN